MGRPPISEEKKMRVVTDIPASINQELTLLAKQEGKTVASFLRNLIYLFLKK